MMIIIEVIFLRLICVEMSILTGHFTESTDLHAFIFKQITLKQALKSFWRIYGTPIGV